VDNQCISQKPIESAHWYWQRTIEIEDNVQRVNKSGPKMEKNTISLFLKK
jgi:hypothetical protein